MSEKSKKPPVEEEDDDFDDEEDGMDPIEYIGAFLHTEDGETLATILSKISGHLDMQNKILVKLLSAVSALKPSTTN